MILKETDTNSNKDISTAVSIGSYTATAVRTVMVRVLINQVAGNGDYVAYVTLTKATVEYRIIPLTTAAAASGLTSIGFVSIGIPVDVDDVLQVYVDGLAGDNSTPDTRVDWYEMDYLRPTVSGRTADIAATGEIGLDFTNRLDTTGILPNVAAGGNGGLPTVNASNQIAGIAGAKNTLDSEYLALKKLLMLLVRKDAAVKADLAVELAELNADLGSGAGAFDSATDSQEAIRDTAPMGSAMRGTDGAYTGTPPSAADIKTAIEADGSKIDHLWETTEDDAGVRRFTANALENAPTGGTALTAQQVRDAMKLAPTAGSPAAGSVDEHLDLIQATTDAIDTSAVTVVSGVDGDKITLYVGATFDETIDDLTIPSDWSKVLFTLKGEDADADSAALVQAQESNPGSASDGLIRFNGAAPGTGENARAELVVNQAAGSVRVRVHMAATAGLLPRAARWDIKVITSDTIPEGTPLVVSSPAEIAYTTTRATS